MQGHIIPNIYKTVWYHFHQVREQVGSALAIDLKPANLFIKHCYKAPLKEIP